MEGYSVTEAASVLGVPTERVWELLARGVLAGAPEGETGMRVYLQPRPAPPPAEPKAPNGNGGAREPERELSPFRELLTEFRNLTERYGQALLALGEARGEVAALRSRVDVLEARMDLRLPTSAAPAPAAAWSSAPMPFPAERTVMPTAPVEPAAAEDAQHVATDDEEEEERRARRRGPRRATESFAEALARAEDPSVPELPGGREAAAALAGLRADAEPADLGLPREVPAAEPVPVAEEAVADAALPAEVAEPFAPESSPGESDAEAETPAVEPDVALAEIADPPELEPAVPHAATPPRVGQPESDVDAEPEIVAEPAAASAPAPPPAEEPASAEPLEWDSERYTTDIEEPDWFAGEAFEVEEPSASLPGGVEQAPSADAGEVAEPDVVEAASQPAAGEIEERQATDEETVLWFGRPQAEVSGADEMEVASGGQRPPAPPAKAPDLPGSEELDQAMAALNALARPESAPEPEAPHAERENPTPVGKPDFDEWPPPRAFGEPRAPAPAPRRPTTTTTTTTTGPASRAYRRLRRIFPG